MMISRLVANANKFEISATARLMVTEYVKFVFAKFRMGLNPGSAAS